MDQIIQEIEKYEVSEHAFRKSCCTAYDLCNHTVTITIPLDIWLKLKAEWYYVKFTQNDRDGSPCHD